MKKITKKMKGSYLKDLHSFSDAVIKLYNYDKHNFFRNFVNLDFIPDVVSLKMKREDMDFLENSFTQAIKSNDEEAFVLIIKRIFLAYKSLFQNLESNNKRLDNCKFLDRTILEQILMLTTYLQDQYNLYQQNQKDNKNNLYTGFESYVSNIKYEKLGENHDLKISAVENFDATVEIINLIITYLYYLKEDEINTGANAFEKVSPYFNASFEEVLYLGQQRWILAGLWEKIKYNHWKIELDKTTKSQEDIFIYLPGNMNLDKANFYGINRINYQATSNMGLQAIQKQKKMDVSFKKMEHFFSSNPSLEQILNMDIQYYNAFKLFSEMTLKVEQVFIDDYYYKISFDGINGCNIESWTYSR